MRSAHTPGPWKLQFGQGIQYDYIIKGPSGCPVACFPHYKPATKKETRSNARMIAAAPDLFEVAESVSLIGFHTMPKGQPDCVCSRCEMVREARAAIFKATGEKS